MESLERGVFSRGLQMRKNVTKCGKVLTGGCLDCTGTVFAARSSMSRVACARDRVPCMSTRVNVNATHATTGATCYAYGTQLTALLLPAQNTHAN